MTYEGATALLVALMVVAAATTLAALAPRSADPPADCPQLAEDAGWQARLDAQLAEANRLLDRLLEEARHDVRGPHH